MCVCVGGGVMIVCVCVCVTCVCEGGGHKSNDKALYYLLDIAQWQLQVCQEH